MYHGRRSTGRGLRGRPIDVESEVGSTVEEDLRKDLRGRGFDPIHTEKVQGNCGGRDVYSVLGFDSKYVSYKELTRTLCPWLLVRLYQGQERSECQVPLPFYICLSVLPI